MKILELKTAHFFTILIGNEWFKQKYLKLTGGASVNVTDLNRYFYLKNVSI
jgi:hypothetical protein